LPLTTGSQAEASTTVDKDGGIQLHQQPESTLPGYDDDDYDVSECDVTDANDNQQS